MSLFAEIEKTIERGFRHWTERMFGQAESNELLIMHRAILDQVAGQVQVLARGQRVFPFARVTVTFAEAEAERRNLLEAAFGEDARLEKDIRQTLEGSGCTLSAGFGVEVKTAEQGEQPFQIEYGKERPAATAPAPEPVKPLSGRLIVVKGKTEQPEYAIGKARLNLGRLAELTDAEQRIVRRNDVVFDEDDDASATVSRKHAHINVEQGEYRLCDDGSEYGTHVFRDGRAIEVPPHNRRGEKLRPGDEIYLGRACLRFEA